MAMGGHRDEAEKRLKEILATPSLDEKNEAFARQSLNELDKLVESAKLVEEHGPR